nr:amino acid ABC transporter permease [Murinocardiopsis flavida]
MKAVPVRHPGRWVAAAVILLLAAMFVNMLLTNPAFDWAYMRSRAFLPNVLEGVRTTLLLTVLAMVIGVVIGVVVAIMRLSTNPILSATAWVYTWFFRAVPRLVLCVLFGNLGILYRELEFGVPFDNYLMPLFGMDGDLRFYSVDMNTVLTAFMAALLGLALSEGAYMSEIVRAGLQSVDKGQTEAAQALGMNNTTVLRRITLPQALRVIVPPTGNETVAMLKDTALVAYVPLNTELWFQLQAIGNRDFSIFPMLIAACLYYLVITSVFMVGQYFLERSFSTNDPVAKITARQTAGGGGM